MSARSLERARVDALSRRLVTAVEGKAIAEEEPQMTRSGAEQRLLDLIRATTVPSPRTNVKVHGFELDAYWPTQRLAVEVDGFAFHGHRIAFERDRRRDRALAAAGITTLRVTWRQRTEEPHAVVADIALAYGRTSNGSDTSR